jgi:hypothetical protein
VEGVMEISEWLEGVLGHEVPGRVLHAGPRWSNTAPLERSE